MGVGLGCSIEIVPCTIRECAVVILAVDLSTSQTLGFCTLSSPLTTIALPIVKLKLMNPILNDVVL